MRLFGQLEAADGGVAFAVRGAKQRALLALLALHRGEPVSADRLIDALWGDGQAANPVNALQAQIGQLRRTLGAGAIVTTEAGYALAVGPGEVDVVRFEQLVAKDGAWRSRARWPWRLPPLGDALGLRRGEPLADPLRRLRWHRTGCSWTSLTLWQSKPEPERTWRWAATRELAGELEAQCRSTQRDGLWNCSSSRSTGPDGRPTPARYTEVRDPPRRRAGHRPRAALTELQRRS